MRSYEIDVAAGRGSWLVRVDGRVMTGAAARASAERIASEATDCLRRAGHSVELRLHAGPDAAAAAPSRAAA
jgi:hypothetical protein